MIEIKNISKSFYRKRKELRVLSGISFKVEQGKIFGLIGSSGAGKSTLLRTVNLLEKPSAGEVYIDGQNLLQLSAAQLVRKRREIGMIFQHFNLLSSRTVGENISFPLELDGMEKQVIQSKVKDALQVVGLADKEHDYPKSLSGGQKQRVAIARTLVTNPKVLLCDEVTSALDPATTRSILLLLKDINRKLGITILLITHEMDVIKAICDEVGVISEGRLVEQGSVTDIFAHPKTAITKSFISASLHISLPASYQSRLTGTPAGLHARPVVKLELSGRTADDPVISLAIRLFTIDIKIISAQLDSAGGKRFGVMLVELSGEQQNLREAFAFFAERNIETEILGYV